MGTVDRIVFTTNEILYITDESEEHINVIRTKINRPPEIVDGSGFVSVKIGIYNTYITDLNGTLVYSISSIDKNISKNYPRKFNKGVIINSVFNDGSSIESILNRVDTEQNTGVFILSSGTPWSQEWDSNNLPRLHIQCDQSMDRFALLGGNIDFEALDLYKDYARPNKVTIYDGMTNRVIGIKILDDNPHYQIVQFDQQVNDFIIEFSSIYQGKIKNILYISSIILDGYYTSDTKDYGKSRIESDLGLEATF